MLSSNTNIYSIDLKSISWDDVLKQACDNTLPAYRAIDELLWARLPDVPNQVLSLRVLFGSLPKICDFLFGNCKINVKSVFELQNFGHLNCPERVIWRLLDPQSRFMRHVIALSTTLGSDEAMHILPFDVLPGPLAHACRNMSSLAASNHGKDPLALPFLTLFDRGPSSTTADQKSLSESSSVPHIRLNSLQYVLVRFCAVCYNSNMSENYVKCFLGTFSGIVNFFFGQSVEQSILSDAEYLQSISLDQKLTLVSTVLDTLHTVLLSRPYYVERTNLSSGPSNAFERGTMGSLPKTLVLAVQVLVKRSIEFVNLLVDLKTPLETLDATLLNLAGIGILSADAALQQIASSYVMITSVRLFPWLLVALENASPTGEFEAVVDTWSFYLTPWAPRNRSVCVFVPFVRLNFFYYVTLFQVYCEQLQNMRQELLPYVSTPSSNRQALMRQILRVFKCFVDYPNRDLVSILDPLEAAFVLYQHSPRRTSLQSARSPTLLLPESDNWQCEALDNVWNLATLPWTLQSDAKPAFSPLFRALSSSANSPLQTILSAFEQSLYDILARYICLKQVFDSQSFSFLFLHDSAELPDSPDESSVFYPETPLLRRQKKLQSPKSLSELSRPDPVAVFQEQLDALVDFPSPLPSLPVDSAIKSWLAFVFLFLVSIVCLTYKGVLKGVRFAAPVFYSVYALARSTLASLVQSAAVSFQVSLQGALEADFDLRLAVQRNSEMRARALALLKSTEATFSRLQEILQDVIELQPPEQLRLVPAQRYLIEQFELDAGTLAEWLQNHPQERYQLFDSEKLAGVKRKLALEVGFGLEHAAGSSFAFRVRQTFYSLGASLGLFPETQLAPSAVIQSGNRSGLYNRLVFECPQVAAGGRFGAHLTARGKKMVIQGRLFCDLVIPPPSHKSAGDARSKGEPVKLDNRPVVYFISLVVSALERAQTLLGAKLNSVYFRGDAPKFLLHPDFSFLFKLAKLQFWVDLVWSALGIYLVYTMFSFLIGICI